MRASFLHHYLDVDLLRIAWVVSAPAGAGMSSRAPHSMLFQAAFHASCSCLPPRATPCSWAHPPAPQPKGLVPSLPPTRTLPGGSLHEISKYLPQTPPLTAVNMGLCLKKDSYGPATGEGSPETKLKVVNGREFSRPEQKA